LANPAIVHHHTKPRQPVISARTTRQSISG
jgi:hypothetical protein